MFASEVKALHDTCARVEEFMPGFFYTSQSKEMKRWYKPLYVDPAFIPSGKLDFAEMRQCAPSTSARARCGLVSRQYMYCRTLNKFTGVSAVQSLRDGCDQTDDE
jgi:hypothetical protein